MKLGVIVKVVNLQTQAYNERRGKIISAKNDNGRIGVEVLLENHKTKSILIKPENVALLPQEHHFGYWGCSDCGGECTCRQSEFHHPDCHHHMNTLRRKGPDCDGFGKCKWMLCCLSEDMEGPCLALDRETRQISTLKYPEKEWVTLPDGRKALQPKKWPYL
eukprot:scaffold2205_cov183-Ochromonas_danica.AAC.34